jgi:MinD superfamily P-loop ATPase containing an inserted ferredoxin domain
MIKINEELCNGCGLCANACHEGAIAIINEKAKLLRDDYCDGLGNCLPVCPTGAISLEEREAPEYNERAVQENMKTKHSGGCPGTMAKSMARTDETVRPAIEQTMQSELMQWPVQIKLVPVNAPYFEDAALLIAADCTAFAFADFHNQFIKKHITLIGCPKLDEGDYTDKLTEILKRNNIKSIKVVRMEVPCCGGIEHAVKQALINSGKMIPWQVVVISTDGTIISE